MESKSVTKASAMKGATNFLKFLLLLHVYDTLIILPALKQRMEKDVKEVTKVARHVKTKLEEIDQDVILLLKIVISDIYYGCLDLAELTFALYLQNLSNRKNPGCEKGTAVDRSRTAMTA